MRLKAGVYRAEDIAIIDTPWGQRYISGLVMKPSSEQEQAAVYREKIINEFCYALGVSRNGLTRRLLGPLFRCPANRLGRIAARADDAVRISGLSGGARRILPDLSLNPSARGAAHIPVVGPLLVVSNHPGVFDSVAILSCVPRKDLKVLLSDVPFTRAFSAARQYFIYVPPDVSGSATTLRASIDHLKNGGALLIFPNGDVEPDPELNGGAAESIKDWSRSIEIMLREVPNAWLQAAMISGVQMPKLMRTPILKIRKTAPQRQKLAEVLQIIRQILFPSGIRTNVHISFAKPIKALELTKGELMPSVITIARRLLDDHLASLSTAL
jgi:1-acyl-sn-glycerol-3-phosphate acyltransferase